MKTQLQKRFESFAIRTGITLAGAIALYLSNIADVREINAWQLATLAVTVVSANIVSEVTKYGYNLRVEKSELEDLESN